MVENKGVAWYDIKGSGWFRDLWVIMHWPYTAWHLSYAVIGAALVPHMNWALFGWTVLAFFLGMGIGGHALDEINGRPLKTTLSIRVLFCMVGVGVGGAVGIGLAVGIRETWTVIPLIAFGGFIVYAYNLEWFHGLFHHDQWFGIGWGVFPVVTAYVAQTHTLSWPLVLVALFAFLSSMAQRKLSLHTRFWRRKVTWLQGSYLTVDGPGKFDSRRITKEQILYPLDISLKYLNGAIVAAALGLLLLQLV